MGYPFLFLSILSCTAKGFFGKKSSGRTPGFRDTVLFNLIRMIICALLGFLLILPEGTLSGMAPSGDLLLSAALFGLSTAGVVVTWQLAVRKNAYMLMDVFMTLGVLIPIVLSSIFFEKSVRWNEWLGLCILFGAVMIMCSYNTGLKGKMPALAFVLLALCGIFNGLADFSYSIYNNALKAEFSVSVFNFYAYVFATVFLGIFFFLLPRKKDPVQEGLVGKLFGLMVIMALCQVGTSYFKILAGEYLDPVILFPLNQGMLLLLSTLMSRIFFKEKITVKCIIGLVTAFVGLLIIKML